MFENLSTPFLVKSKEHSLLEFPLSFPHEIKIISKGSSFNVLPYEFPESVRDLFIEYIDWMVQNGKAVNPEAVLIGNAIAYLQTGKKGLSRNAEETDLFLDRMIQVGNEITDVENEKENFNE